MMVDAVFRTLFRVLIHRRRLLEWVTSAQINEDIEFDGRRLVTQIAAERCLRKRAVCRNHQLCDCRSGQHSWPIAVPLFAALWILSPIAAARWRERTAPAAGHLSVGTSDMRALRLIGRRTWRFFERFVGAQDNMLPPDNFQEDPEPVVAHRTSPTNIGLYLLSIIAAHDFGWIGTLDSVDRLEATSATLAKMERQRGHFLPTGDRFQ